MKRKEETEGCTTGSGLYALLNLKYQKEKREEKRPDTRIKTLPKNSISLTTIEFIYYP